MTDHIARQMKEAKKHYTGTVIGGNPPDAGSALVNGQRIAWVPVDLIEMSGSDFQKVQAAYKEKGAVLSRTEVRAAIAKAEAND